jgi:hypothetical protein
MAALIWVCVVPGGMFCSGSRTHGMALFQAKPGRGEKRMFKHFGKIFWGLLLVVLDFTINFNRYHFDALPDFIGYVLIALGCAGLANVARGFTVAAKLSWALAVSDLIAAVLMGRAGRSFEFFDLVVSCGMMWFLLGGVMELAMSKQRSDLSRWAARWRIAYIALSCAGVLILLIAQTVPGMVKAMLITLAVCRLVLFFLILFLIHQVRYQLARGESK